MATKLNDVPQHLQNPFKTAVRRWKENESPDDFTTDITIETENGTQELTVSIYHHETFPLGGQLFTVDIRSQDHLPRQPPTPRTHRTLPLDGLVQ